MEGEGILARRLTRRNFLAATTVTLGGAALVTMGADCDPAMVRRIIQAQNAGPPHHRVWVWRFSSDGSPAQIAANLAGNGLGVMVKTHDGLDWMGKWDPNPSAVSGPQQVQALANFFENNGVPFHAWCVVRGTDPVAEAQMAASVLASGVRSLTLDLEGSAGFWAGSRADAVRYGNELRARNPYGRIDLSIDPRPWRIYLAPMDEFVTFTDVLAPQLYWDTFNTAPNIEEYTKAGYPPGPGGITPEFLVDVTAKVLARYGRDVIPAGQGACSDPAAFPRFMQRAWMNGMGTVSAWRYSVTRWETLLYMGQHRATIAPQPTAPLPPPPSPPPPAPGTPVTITTTTYLNTPTPGP